MAFGRKLLDLITMSRSIPEYAPTDPRTVPILGPDGQDFSIEQESLEGPLRQTGSRRVSTPFGARLKAALPDMISSGITAAAHQNTAGGGPADVFGALQDVQEQRERKNLQGVAMRRQTQQDSIAERRARVDEGNLNRPPAPNLQTRGWQDQRLRKRAPRSRGRSIPLSVRARR